MKNPTSKILIKFGQQQQNKNVKPVEIRGIWLATELGPHVDSELF